MKCILSKTELSSTIGLSLYIELSSKSQQVIAAKVFKRKKKVKQKRNCNWVKLFQLL